MNGSVSTHPAGHPAGAGRHGSSRGGTPRVILVPGLRGPAPDHWQERLADALDAVLLRTDRASLDLAARVRDLEDAVAAATADGAPVVLVAHSAGVLTLVHWALGQAAGQGPGWRASTEHVVAALLVAPPALRDELPAKYPRLDDLAAHGWLPLPARPLPFPATVGISDDDPLGPVGAVTRLAADWGAQVLPLGRVGHANPDSGFGPWPWMQAHVAALVGRAAGRDSGPGMRLAGARLPSASIAGPGSAR